MCKLAESSGCGLASIFGYSRYHWCKLSLLRHCGGTHTTSTLHFSEAVTTLAGGLTTESGVAGLSVWRFLENFLEAEGYACLYSEFHATL